MTKATKRNLALVAAALICLQGSAWGQRATAGLEVLREGTLILLRLDEELTTQRILKGEPILFQVAQDVKMFEGSPVLISRDSKVKANVVRARRAGRLVGKAAIHIDFNELILAETSESYKIKARLIDVAGHKVDGEVIVRGRGHAVRDTFGWIFFSPVQLAKTAQRGPDLIIRTETVFIIKLLEPLLLN